MKKFLSLVLALVMTMSLVTISAGAKDFTDDSKITYKEAVDVISAIKVVDGYTDGAFNPSNTLTRGAAAKIICNLVLGPTAAGALGVTAAPFKDVAVNNVFAGYIAYCSAQGIINGYPDGTFRPAATVTGYQFLKMLLGALGYDSTIEKFTGNNYTVQVAKLATSLKLTKGNSSFVGTKAMTREEACLYAFNTLKATMVEYATKGQNITVNGIVINTGASAAEKVPHDEDSGYKTASNDKYTQFCEQYFENLKLKSSDRDDFGRPSHTWYFGTKQNSNTKVGTYSDNAVLTYTTGVKGTVLADDIDDAGYEIAANGVVDATNNKDGSFVLYTNGNPQKISKTTADTELGKTAKLGGNGVAIEVYGNDDGYVTDVVVVTTYIAEITKVVADRASTKSTDERALKLDVVGGKSIVANADETAGFEEIYASAKKGDYVLVTPENDMASGKTCNYALTIVEPETVSGAVSKVTSSAVTIDGTSYEIALLNEGVEGLKASATSKTIYLDEYGYAIFSEDSVSASSDLVYVTAVYTEKDKYETATNYAQIVHTDGTIEEIETVEKQTKVVNKVCSYAYDDTNSAYVLTDETAVTTLVEDVAGDSYKTTSAKTVGGKYFTEDVTFVYVNKSGSKLAVTTANGVQKINSIAANSFAVLNDDGDVDAVFIRSAATTAVDASDALYVKSNASAGTATDLEGKTGTTYSFYKDGEKMTEIATMDGTGFMSYSIDSATGRYTMDGLVAADGAWNKVVLSGVVNGKYLSTTAKEGYAAITDATLTDDCVIYDLSDNAYNEVSDLSDLKDLMDEHYTVTISVIYDTTDNEISCIYVDTATK